MLQCLVYHDSDITRKFVTIINFKYSTLVANGIDKELEATISVYY